MFLFDMTKPLQIKGAVFSMSFHEGNVMKRKYIFFSELIYTDILKPGFYHY